MSSSDQFNASSSMAGYLFQCRLALLHGLELASKNPNGQISIEKFDDISLHDENVAKCFIQAKHHILPKALTDKSVDLWKTLRIWIEHFNSGIVTAADSRYMLITTATAETDYAMANLRAEANIHSRIVARDLLRKAARESQNKKTDTARKAFLALTDDEVEEFLRRVELIDQHPNLIDVMSEIENRLAIASPTHSSSVAERLEGWWIGTVGRCMVEEDAGMISVQDIIIKAHEIGRMFGVDSLPIDEGLEDEANEYLTEDEKRIFIKQMRMVASSKAVIERGIQDFYRASTQRSKWARENLLLDGETSRYDRKLRDLFERERDFEPTPIFRQVPGQIKMF